MNRGVEKRNIYLRNQDYCRFILGLEFFNRENIHTDLWKIIGGIGADPTSVRLLRERQRVSDPLMELMAFTLMPNHFHLIVREIVAGGTAEFMKRMGGYSTYFNSQHERVGSLFQNRYKSVEIRTTEQAIATFVYVHTNHVALVEKGWGDFEVKNPKKALSFLNDYRWSSYRDYVGEPRYPEVTDRSFYHKLIGGQQKCRELVEAWVRGKAGSAGGLADAALE